LHISIDLAKIDEQEIGNMQRMLAVHKGSAALFLHLKEEGKKSCVVKSRSLTVNVDYDMLAQLCLSVGPRNIKLVRGTAHTQ
jgi:hypothetical protein